MFTIILVTCILGSINILSQTTGDFRTIADGNWSNLSVWETWNGTGWVPPATPPSLTSNVAIRPSHEVQISSSPVTVNSIGFTASAGGGQNPNLATLTTAAGVVLNVTQNISISASSNQNATINLGSSSSLNVGGNISFATGGAVAGLNVGNGTLAIGGLLGTGGTVTLGTNSTVNFNGGSQTIADLAYYNLTLSGSGTKTLINSLSLAAPQILTVNADATLSPGGNVVISGTGTLTGTGTVLVTRTASGTENFLGQYTISTKDLSNLTVEYAGDLAQTISAGTFNNLTINTSDGVALTDDVIVNGTLTLSDGNLNPGSNTLTLGSNATISGGSVNSFVNGPMANTINTSTQTTKTFPIGKGTAYRPVTIEVTQSTTDATTYTAEIFNSAPPSGYTLPGTITNVSSVRYWNVTKGVGAEVDVATITLTYGDDDGVLVPTDLRIVKGQGGTGEWENIGNDNSSSSTVTSATFFTGFSDFALGSAAGSNPLPVELTSFTASTQKNVVVLNWKTATEIDNYGFEVERKNGKDWEKIAFLEGHGNSNSVKSYTYTDQKVLAGKTYKYRLKQLDTDGKFEYSKTVEAALKAPEKFALMQNHPNPFNPITTITYSIPQAGNVSLKIYDVIGNQIAQLVNENQAQGTYEISFNASNYPSGVYFYRIETPTFAAVKKMLLVK